MHINTLAAGLAKRSPSSMLCNTTSSLIVRGAESAVHCGEAAQRGLAPCTALSGQRRRGGRSVAAAARREAVAAVVRAAG